MTGTPHSLSTVSATDAVQAVTVYWRPGCPHCFLVRRTLRRAGVPIHEVNIWDDRSAAEVVRSHAAGDETVPTVVVGEEVLVNPPARVVLEILREKGHLPSSIRGEKASRSRIHALPGAARPWIAGLAAALAAALAWLLLARAEPTTTYHAAPPLVVAAWPVVQRAFSVLPLSRLKAGLSSAGGALVALVTTWLLVSSGDLEGPTVIHRGGAGVEALVFVLAAAVAMFLTSRAGRDTPQSHGPA